MIRIRNFVICDNTQVVPTPDKKGAITILVNPQPVLRAKYIPGVLSFSISFGVSGIKITDINNIEVTIYPATDKEKCTIVKENLTLPLEPDQDPEEISPTINLDMRNVEITQEGELLIDIGINNAHVAQFSTTVKRVKG